MAVFMVTYVAIGNKTYAKLESYIADKNVLTRIAEKLAELTETERIKFTRFLPSNFPTSTILLELPESDEA